MCTCMCRCMSGEPEDAGSLWDRVIGICPACYIGSGIWTLVLTAAHQTLSHWTPFSIPLSAFFVSLSRGLTVWLRLDLNLGSRHLRLPGAGVIACALLSLCIPLNLVSMGWSPAECPLLLNLYFKYYILKSLVCDMGTGIKPMASLMLRPHSQVLKF